MNSAAFAYKSSRARAYGHAHKRTSKNADRMYVALRRRAAVGCAGTRSMPNAKNT